MTTIRILDETDSDRGWSFRVVVGPRELTVSLAWVDYDHLSRGAISPAAVVERAMQDIIEHVPADDIDDTFDLARILRRHPEIERRLRAGEE
ncbi:MAG: hypothetical protein AAGB34_04390 [Planctomycetota bacterium]